eukprot:3599063-Alexandrium_andersonii.AAC.1
MSASLVGSEMCIRDRLRPVGRRVSRPYQRLISLGPGAGGSETNGSETVSYTHLTLPTICSV